MQNGGFCLRLNIPKAKMPDVRTWNAMTGRASNGNDRGGEPLGLSLTPDALELISLLDREIEELTRLAPAGCEETIAGLRDAMNALHDALRRRPKRTQRR
jgi:hypothetical protein